MPGATVRRVERETNDDDTPASAYEVEMTRPDGTRVSAYAGHHAQHHQADSHQGKKDEQVPNDLHQRHLHSHADPARAN